MVYFYGFSHKEVMQMRLDIFNLYWEAITPIEARNALMGFDVSTYPRMSDRNRSKTHRKYHKLAYPETWSGHATPKVTVDQFFGKPKVKDGK